VVTIFFCETAAKIRRNEAIASDIRIAIDGGISFSNGNGGSSTVCESITSHVALTVLTTG
jgi:hypothetical protein